MSRSTRSRLTMAAMLGAGLMGNRLFNFDPEGVAGAGTVPPAAATPGSIDAMRQEFGRLQTEALGVIDGAEKDGNRGLTAEERTGNDKRFTRMKAIKDQIDDRLRFAGLALSGDVSAGGTIQTQTDPPGRDEHEGRIVVGKSNEKFDTAAFREAMNHFARTGDMSRVAKFATTTATGSGAYLPKQVGLPITIRRLANAFRSALDAAGASPISIGSPVAFSLPIGDDTANSGQAQSEGATSGTVLDESDASLSFSPTLYSSKQKWFSNTIILANTFDAAGYVVPMLQKRLERIQQSTWTTALKLMTTGATTLAATTAITYAEVLTWEHSLAPEYRDDAVFMVADSLWKLLRGLVDDQHRPIIDLDPTNTFVGKLHGKPIIVNDSLDAVAANKTVGAFVSAEAIKIVDAGEQRITRYTLDSAHPDQTGFEIFQNGDCQFIQAGVKLLKTAIS